MALSKIYYLVTWIRSFSPSVSCLKVEQRIQSNNKWEVFNSLLTNFEFLFFTLSGSKTFLRWFNFLQTEWNKCFKFGSVSSFLFIKPAEQCYPFNLRDLSSTQTLFTTEIWQKKTKVLNFFQFVGLLKNLF